MWSHWSVTKRVKITSEKWVILCKTIWSWSGGNTHSTHTKLLRCYFLKEWWIILVIFLNGKSSFLIDVFVNTELKFSWLRLTLCISGVTGVGVPLPTFSLYKTYVSPMDPKRKKERQLQKIKQNRSFVRRLRLLNYLGSKIRWKEICFQSKLIIVRAHFQSRTLPWNPCGLTGITIAFCA